MSAAAGRDLNCVGCDQPPGGSLPLAEHHRILGNTSDERASNKLLLCGTGNVPPGCHGRAHHYRKAFGDPNGYIISRHGPRHRTRGRAVYYNQPSLGRVGWFLLDDDGELAACTPAGVPLP